MRWRRVGLAAAALLALLALGVALLHTPFVRRRALAALKSRVAAAGVQLDASRLSYNLLALSAELDAVSVTAAGSRTPFLSADAVRVNLPWSVLSGALAIQSLDIEHPRAVIIRDAAGKTNLPSTSGGGAGPTGPVSIGRLRVRDLDLRFSDAASRTDVTATGLALDLEPEAGGTIAGALTMAGQAVIRVAGRQTSVQMLRARLAFDGSALTLVSLDVSAPELRARVTGRVDLLSANPQAALRYEARADVARLAPWVGVSPPEPQGELNVSGSVEGPLAAPVARVDLTSRQLTWPGLGGLTLAGHGELAGGMATIDSLRATIADGSITGAARVRLDAQGQSSVRLAWEDLDARTLAGLVPEMPVRVASRAGGEATLEWTGGSPLNGRGHALVTLRAPAVAPAAVPVAGRVDLDMRDGRWSLNADPQAEGIGAATATLAGRIAQPVSASSVSGSVTADIPNAGAALARLAAGGWPIVDVATANTIRGSASLRAAIGGTLTAPRASGRVQAADLWVGRTGPAAATAAFDATPRRAALSAARLTVGPDSVSATGAIAFANGGVQARVSGLLPALAPLAAALPARWRPGGAAQFQATVGGTLSDPAVEAEMSATDLAIAGARVGDVHSRVHVAHHVAIADELAIEQGSGRITLTGRYRWTDGHYAAALDAADFALALQSAVPAAPIDAQFDAHFEGEGMTSTPQLAGTVSFSRLAWRDYRAGAVRATIDVRDGRASVRADVPAAHASLAAALVLGTRAFTAGVALTGADLSALVRPTGPAAAAVPAAAAGEPPPAPISGTVTLTAAAGGRLNDLPASSVDVTVSTAALAVRGVPVRADRPLRVRYAHGQVTAEDVALGIGAASLSASGRLGPDVAPADGLRLTLTGPIADVMPLVHAVAPASRRVDASGSIDLQLHASGVMTAPVVSGALSLTGGAVRPAALPAATGIDVHATWGNGVVRLDDARADWQGASLTASGSLPLRVLGDRLPAPYLRSLPPNAGPAHVELRVMSLTPKVLAPFVGAATLDRMGGRVDAHAVVDARGLDLPDLTADVTFDRAELALAGVPMAQSVPTHLRLHDGRLDVAEWSWAGAGNKVDATGGITLGGASPVLDLGLRGSLDLRMLGVLSPDLAASGRAVLDLTATGPAADPAMAGRVSIENAGVIVREPRIAISDLTGAATLAQNRIHVERLSGHANGGTLEADGTLEYSGLALTGGSLALRGRGLALDVPENLRTEVDADLTLAETQGAPALTGKVTILRGAYREPISLAEQLLAGGVTSISAGGPEVAPGPFDNVQLGIAVVTAEDVLIDNNYARAEVASNLTITGTIGQPAMAGRLTVREGGNVFLGGRTYQVQRGTIDFVSPTRIEPDLDLALQTRIQDYDITLAITGTPETLGVSLTSPGQSEEDVVSLLVTGQLARESTGVQTEAARGQLLMLLSGEVLGFAGRAVGLDSVQVSRGLGAAGSDFDLLATDTDPSARLTVTKRLRSNVELIYSQSLKASGDITWVASYRPLPRFEVRATNRDDNSRAYEFRHELTFGRPAGAAAVQPAQANGGGARPKIAGVRFTGTPGLSEAELHGLVSLHEGDRFDFYRWQNDRDRLSGWYQDHDYLEARVRADRQPVQPEDPHAGVVLQYAIDRGPHTRLEIDGFTLSDEVVARMKDAWSRSVFDGFLVDDLDTLAREALARGGYLQAQVTAAVMPSSGAAEKTIAVHIVPGRRVEDRAIRFSGNQAISSDELQAAVDSAGLSIEAWIDPAALEPVLERYYRTRGYLTAAVSPGRPRFEGGSAVLPVRVAEGPPFAIGPVTVIGARALPVEQVRATFGLEPGAPYLPAMIEPARRRVEDAYLHKGYNDVRVSVQTAAAPDQARVDLALTIDEGAQQIVSAVDVRGAHVTSPAVIDRAVDLTAGAPADLTDVYHAQKRLYDTGVFQRADVTLEPAPAAAAPATPGVQPVRAVVALQELPLYRFRYGFRLNDEVAPADPGREVRPAFVADLLRRNLFGRALTAGVAGEAESDIRVARGYLSVPTLFGRRVVTNLFATASRQFFPPASEFDLTLVERVSELTLEQRFRPATHMDVTYGYTFDHKHNFEPHPDPASPLPPHDVSTDIARLTATYAWDTRDDPSDAHRGWLHSSGLEFGSLALGSDLRFIKYLAQQEYFRTVDRQVVLASAFRLGLGRGFGGQDLDEKFHVGGGTSVRGFAEGALGNSDFFGPLGGNAMIVLNQEVRFPIFKWVRGVGFLDAGNVFTLAHDVTFANLEAGTGVGLRIHSPFALLRLDFGVPLTRRDQEPSGRWYIGIGQTF